MRGEERTMATTRVVSNLPDGTALSRYLIAKGLGGLGQIAADAHAWRQTPQVLECLHEEFLFTKAAVPPGTTSDATNAAPLAAFGIAKEALTLLRGLSIIGALEPRMRRIPFRTKVPRETGSGTGGAWVGENLATPIAATSFDEVTQEVYKAGKIVALSKELLKVGNPEAERTVRETVMAGVAAFLDAQFLTNTVTAVARLRPAAITAGAVAVTSTGATAAAISSDLAALVAAISTNGSGLTWIMRKRTMATIAGALGAASGLPQTLWGLPVIVSDNSPAQVTLVDAAQILYSDDGTIELDTSEQAVLQMDSAPTDPPVAATIMTSLWSLDLWAVKAMKWIAYQRALDGSVSYMTVTY
jgi:hypothetical protein